MRAMQQLPVVLVCRTMSTCAVGQIRSMFRLVPPHSKRGVSRSSRTLSVGCGGRVGLRVGHLARTNNSGTHGQVARSWPPDAEVKFAMMRFVCRADDGGKKARSPGRMRSSR